MHPAAAGRLARALGLAAALMGSSGTWAQSFTLAGRMGDKALVVMSGRTVVLAVGQSDGGLKLVRWEGPQAVLEYQGSTYRVREGDGPARLAPTPGASAGSGGSREIVMHQGSGGHFFANGQINGHPVRFMVDTGATMVALSRTEAQRLGLDLRQARAAVAGTAGGAVMSYELQLTRVRIGDVEVFNVNAAVIDAPMPFILLGNSFLDRFQMRRDNDVMRLQQR